MVLLKIKVLIALLLVQVASGAFAFQPNERTNKTHVLQLGTIGSFGLNETQNHILSLARYAAWCVNNQFTILPDVEIQLYYFSLLLFVCLLGGFSGLVYFLPFRFVTVKIGLFVIVEPEVVTLLNVCFMQPTLYRIETIHSLVFFYLPSHNSYPSIPSINLLITYH